MDVLIKILFEQKLIILSAFAGIGTGFILKNITEQPWSQRDIMYLKFPGELFMRFINCLILPLIASGIISATYNLRKSGRVGLMALYYYATTTLLGITLSVLLVQTVRPGESLRNETIVLESTSKHFLTVDTFLDLLRNLIPDNIVNAALIQYHTVLEKPENNDSVLIEQWQISHEDVPGANVLGTVFFSLILGLAIGNMDGRGEPLMNFFHCLSEATMQIMKWIIKTVPINIFCLLSAKVLEVTDFSSIIKRLGIYILTVFTGLLIQGFILLPLVYFIKTGKSPYKIISKLGPALITAFTTSSSTATVPVTIECLERIGIDKKISRFIAPIGATINMDGIALYETIGAIFIIQLHGLNYSLFQVIAISIVCTVSCIGAAGLPSGGYAMLITVLNSVGIPAEDVSLIIAVDWFVDRFRTTINVIADALGAGIISNYYENGRKDLIAGEVDAIAHTTE